MRFGLLAPLELEALRPSRPSKLDRRDESLPELLPDITLPSPASDAEDKLLRGKCSVERALWIEGTGDGMGELAAVWIAEVIGCVSIGCCKWVSSELEAEC
jgi:hypothetical protein